MMSTLSVSVRKDWSKVYDPSKLRLSGLRAFAKVVEDMASFRHPRLVWSEIAKSVKANSPGLIVVVCDVLEMDRHIEIDVPCYIFARQIIHSPGRYILANRTDGNYIDFGIVTQDIQTAGSREISSIPFSVVYEDEKGDVVQTDDMISATYARPAAFALVLRHDETDLRAELPSNLADDYLDEGEPLALMLGTQFSLAGQQFEDDPDYSLQVLEWIAELLEGNVEGAQMASDVHALHHTIIGLVAAKAQGCVLVPELDHSVYAGKAQNCLDLLNRREQQLKDWIAIEANDTNWADSAQAALEDHQNDTDLAASLVQQAKKTRDQAENARMLATKQVIDDREAMIPLKTAFDLGIEKWRQDATLDASFDLVQNTANLLAQIPAIVVAGPTVATMPAFETAKGFLDVGIDAAKTIKLPKADPSKIKDIFRRKKKTRLIIEDDDDETNRRNYRLNFYEASFDDDDDLLVDSMDFEVVRNSPMPGLFDDDFDDYVNSIPVANQNDDTAKIKVKADVDKAVQKERKAQQDKLLSSLKAAGNSAVGIGKSIQKLIHIQQQAEQALAASENVLLRVNSQTSIAFSAIDPAGIDVATGGSQVFDHLALEIDNQFEVAAGGILETIGGGNAYHQAFKGLIVDGRAMCLARLSLAKANADLAVAILHENAAKRAQKIFAERREALGNKVLKDDAMIQAAYDRMEAQKRGVFLAMDAYIRAFQYFTLADDAMLPRRPSVTASVDTFNESIKLVGGQSFAVETIKDIFGNVQTFTEEVTFDDVPTMKKLQASKGTLVELPRISTEIAKFRLLRRLRLTRVDVWINGLDYREPIAVRLQSGGRFRDRINSGENGASHTIFMCKPVPLLYTYQIPTLVDEIPETPQQMIDLMKDVEPKVSTEKGLRFANAFQQATPFTDWRIQVTAQDGTPIDLSAATSVTIRFKGDACI